MFWLLRFRGERWVDTLALWVNAIAWQIQKILYKIAHPASRKQDFVNHIIKNKTHLHWTTFPFDLGRKYFYDSSLGLWIEAIGITWLYFTHPAEYPGGWMNFLRAGQIGLDIGAHRGYWSLLYHKRILPGGLILAMEPDPENYAHLLRNIGQNGISHIIPLRLAAWSQSMSLSLEGGGIDPVSSFLSRVRAGGPGDTLAISVDALVEALALPRLDWIKMDIEGAEVEALRGAMRTLKRYKPTLWIEFHDTFIQLEALLAEAGYMIKGKVYHHSAPSHTEAGYLWAEPEGVPS